MSQINERLLQLQEQMLRKTHLQTKLREMEMQEKALTAEVQELLDAMKAEDENVRRLEGRTLAACFYGVIGKRAEKLNQKRREAYAARVKYDAAVRSLTSVREDIRALLVENRLLSDCSDEYQRLMRKKREMVKASGCAEGEEILRLEEKSWELGRRSRSCGMPSVPDSRHWFWPERSERSSAMPSPGAIGICWAVAFCLTLPSMTRWTQRRS